MDAHTVDIIEKKRDGETLSTAEIEKFVAGVTRGDVPDYQIAALLMAIYFQGMDRRETVDLTLAMARSGDELDLHDVAPIVVDKHSSGGVGDKTTLVVQPLVAACGLPVGKMSGRGLGPTGGTLDKMDSFRGWRSDLSLSQFKRQLGEIGLVLAGQTAELAPADGRLYALRDVTGTVASLPLIAASIMSKKLAAGADAILLDVKAGSGAFMESVAEAKDLARMMVDIGHDAGRAMTALISDMNQPLGFAVGNALEVKEAIATLLGEPTAGFAVPEDFWEHCQVVAAHMLLLVNAANDLDAALAKVTAVRDDGSAWEKFRQMVVAQGGSADQLDDPRTLPAARIVAEIKATAPGYIAAMDVAKLGWATVHLGAGRQEKGQPIDHAVGFVMPAKVGDYVEKGSVIAVVHANDEPALDQAQEEILGAISWSQQPTEPLPQFYGSITG